MRCTHGRSVSTNFLRCLVERLALPDYERSASLEQAQRVTVQVDGSMVPMQVGWKEAKLGVVFSEQHHSRGDDTHRGAISEATYVATMGAVNTFASHLSKTLPEKTSRRERFRAQLREPDADEPSDAELVWVADGAAWIWKLQQRVCPQAIGILDFAHALEHGATCGKELLDEEPATCALWKAAYRAALSPRRDCMRTPGAYRLS